MKNNLTIKQRNFLDILSENIGNKGKDVKSLYEMMLEAGYSESMAKQQSNVLKSDGVSSALNKIVGRLEKAREEALNRLEDTIDRADYKDLINSIDKLTKNIELLSGRDTSRPDLGLKELSDDELRKIAGE